MKVYKFGGASVRDASGVRNLKSIIYEEKAGLFVVVSAMGKTTNALESVVEALYKDDSERAMQLFADIQIYHNNISNELGLDIGVVLDQLYNSVCEIIINIDNDNYDKLYDSIVGYGELFSTTIFSAYLQSVGLLNTFIDIRKFIITDNSYRCANINFLESERRFRDIKGVNNVFISQGFIGGTLSGDTTTLGREGSDYTAAAVASLIGAESVTIWKDVEGVLNCDPKLFDDAVLIDRLSYLDAIELSYSGAQIIHPKTIKPLHNNSIPLYVRPFANPSHKGSSITSADSNISIPIIIVRKNQVLLSIRNIDFSFALEESMPRIFEILNIYHQKVNLVQSSALAITVSLDDSRDFSAMLAVMSQEFDVRYNNDLELITIRGYTTSIVERETTNHDIYLRQQTRRSFRAVRRAR